jgi:proprotein convertase subtilisin/kexin type 5
MYPDLTQNPVVCVLCVSPCVTCTTLNFCNSCISTHFLYQNNCTAQCPVGTTVGNTVTQLCDLCNTSCLTCAGTINNCTSCPGVQILYLGGCIDSCPSPLVYKPSISTCGPCDVQCKTCTGTSSNCTTCDPASSYQYYLNNTCLVVCPSLYY